MATKDETSSVKEPKPEVVGKVENPGHGERWGKAVGPDVDKSFPVVEFFDPNTGEPV